MEKIRSHVDYDFKTTGEDSFKMDLVIYPDSVLYNILIKTAIIRLKRMGKTKTGNEKEINEFNLEDIDQNILKMVEKGMHAQLKPIWKELKEDHIEVMQHSLGNANITRKTNKGRWKCNLTYVGTYIYTGPSMVGNDG